MQLRNYTRWREDEVDPTLLVADILGGEIQVIASPETGRVFLGDASLTPDEARMYGVRLIDAAVLADGDRAIRRPPTTH